MTERRRSGIDARATIAASPTLGEVLDTIASGVFSSDDEDRFRSLLDSIINHDYFLVTADFEAYYAKQREVGKLWRDRYKLQRFGRGGFVSAALRTRTPIIPISIVGAEEIYPIIGNIKPLARITGLPYVPITPLFPWLGPLGMLPLPSKWLIEFGEPIETEPYADEADDPIVVFNLADQVRETIQLTLYRLLGRRRNAFQG